MERLHCLDGQEGFDLERYLTLSGATRPQAFDWSDPGPALDDDALFCLGYMMDIESHTIIYLRELLSTAVVEDVIDHLLPVVLGLRGVLSFAGAQASAR